MRLSIVALPKDLASVGGIDTPRSVRKLWRFRRRWRRRENECQGLGHAKGGLKVAVYKISNN